MQEKTLGFFEVIVCMYIDYSEMVSVRYSTRFFYQDNVLRDNPFVAEICSADLN